MGGGARPPAGQHLQGRRPDDPGLRVLADISAAALFLVVVMGTLVTDTGSGRGCGGTWPLCNGRLLPAATLHSMIEYSHRAVAGAVGLLVVAVAAWAWRRAGRHLEVRVLALVAAGFVVVQALLGGADVLWPESASVLALHMGFSLLAFAGAVLLAAVLRQRASGALAVRAVPIPGDLRTWTWVALGYIYALIYVGAFVAHRGDGLACLGWPLCNGRLIPRLSAATLVVMVHRMGAVGALALLLWLYARFRSLADRPDLRAGAAVALGLLLLQILAGALLVLTRLSTGGLLLHGSVVSVLFAALAYLCLQVLPARPAAAEPRAGTPAAADRVR